MSPRTWRGSWTVVLLALCFVVAYAGPTGWSSIQTTEGEVLGVPVRVPLDEHEFPPATSHIYDFGTVFRVENVGPTYEDQLAITFYLLNPHEINEKFRLAILNVSVWYEDASGTEVATDDYAYFEHTELSHATFVPGVRLSEVALAPAYIVKAELLYSLMKGPGDDPTPRDFHFDVTLDHR